jgi:uncharacterized protein YjdB
LAVIVGVSGAGWYARQQLPAKEPTLAAGLKLLPTATTLTVGDSAVLSAAALDGSGATMDDQAIEWRSRDSAIAKINNRGEVVAAGIGVTFVLVDAGSHTDSIRVTVKGAVTSNATTPTSQSTRPSTRKATVARVTVSPARLALDRDSSATLRVRAEDDAGRRLNGRTVRWSSADGAIAVATRDGRVTAVAAGTTTISVTVEGKTKSVPITVRAEPPVAAGLTVADYRDVMSVGTRHELAAALTDTRGQPMEANVTWVSRDTMIVIVDSAGLVTAVAPGITWLVVAAEELRDSVSVQVMVAAEDQIRGGVETFLAALSARQADRVEPILDHGDDDQRKLAAKLLDKIRGGQWDLKTDTVPQDYYSRIADDRAEAGFTVELAWKGAFGGRKREDVGFVALFVRTGAEWRIVEVRVGEGTGL